MIDKNSSRIAPQSRAPERAGSSRPNHRKTLSESILSRYPGGSKPDRWQQMEIEAGSWENGMVRLVFDQIEGPGKVTIDFPIREPHLGKQPLIDLTNILTVTGNPAAKQPDELIGSILFMYFPWVGLLLPAKPLEVLPASAVYGPINEAI